MTRFLILGATGPSGLEFVRKTLQVYPNGSIVIYARSPDKLPEDFSKNSAITIIKGQLEELDKVETAIQGVDVILSALGAVPGHPTNGENPLAIFHGHLIDLMHKHNIKRGIFLSTASYKDPQDKPNWKYAALGTSVKLFIAYARAEIIATADVFLTKGADLEYTLVRIPILTNANTEGVVAGYVGDGKTGIILSRKAYAAFVVGEVEKREWIRKAPVISNA